MKPPAAEDATPASAPAREVTHETVKALARRLDRPLELAAPPLAAGGTPDERAESVRALFREAVDGAFGSSGDKQLLRACYRATCSCW